MAPRKSRQVAEFGDFQTPDPLAAAVLSVVKRIAPPTSVIIEPSCGRGSFLEAALTAFPEARLFGLDINADYLAHAHSRLAGNGRAQLTHGDFFTHDWDELISDLAAPLMVLGNPPWVTNAELGSLGSRNLPTKSNFQGMKGIDAVTGKANFDISEWMLLQNLSWITMAGGTLAVLCKVSVARKVLASAWKRNIPISNARIYGIDALAHFGAAVDACLFVVHIDGRKAVQEAEVFGHLADKSPISRIGYVDDIIASNVDEYKRYNSLRGISKDYKWRSGVKHDCAKIMELHKIGEDLVNGYDQVVDFESTYVYPLSKSSDVAGKKKENRSLFTIVTQSSVGEETASIAHSAPKTWKYLNEHAAALDRRTSVIYRNKPRFSIFGVGAYTFAPWKIAISGLYKQMNFRLFGPRDGKPMVFDDTVYFLPFESRKEAELVLDLLNGEEAQSFLKSMVFWDDKRPITVELLKRLDIPRLAGSRGQEMVLRAHITKRQVMTSLQMPLI